MPEEEQRKQNAWFHSITTSSDLFIEETTSWLQENGGGNYVDSANVGVNANVDIGENVHSEGRD